LAFEFQKTVEEALQLDDETNTDLWRKALAKEMSKVKVAWRSVDDYTPEQVCTGKAATLIGYQEIRCHVIFDVKMDFTRKARFVAGGHMTDRHRNLADVVVGLLIIVRLIDNLL
jgi:hypothetical protein